MLLLPGSCGTLLLVRSLIVLHSLTELLLELSQEESTDSE